MNKWMIKRRNWKAFKKKSIRRNWHWKNPSNTKKPSSNDWRLASTIKNVKARKPNSTSIIYAKNKKRQNAKWNRRKNSFKNWNVAKWLPNLKFANLKKKPEKWLLSCTKCPRKNEVFVSISTTNNANCNKPRSV